LFHSAWRLPAGCRRNTAYSWDILTYRTRATWPPGPYLFGEADMSNLLLLTNALEPSAEVLPALWLLLHGVRVAPAEASALIDAPPSDAGRGGPRKVLVQAESLCRLPRTAGRDCPLVVIVGEGGLAAMTAEWRLDDVILARAGPA